MLNDNWKSSYKIRLKTIIGSTSLANDNRIYFLFVFILKLHKNEKKCQMRLIHTFV